MLDQHIVSQNGSKTLHRPVLTTQAEISAMVRREVAALTPTAPRASWLDIALRVAAILWLAGLLIAGMF